MSKMSPGVVQRVNEHPEFKKKFEFMYRIVCSIYLPTYVVLPWKMESVNRGRYTYKNVCTMYGHILSWLITFLCHFIYCLIKIGRSFLLLTYGSFHHISVITCTIYINNINNISNVNFNDTVEIILTLNYCNNVKWILMNRIRVKRGSLVCLKSFIKIRNHS